MTLVNHIESIVLKSARMVGFINRISREFSDPYTYKTLYVDRACEITNQISDFNNNSVIKIKFEHSNNNTKIFNKIQKI
jgi:hypothetical protein